MKKINLKRFFVLAILCVVFCGMTSVSNAKTIVNVEDYIDIGVVVCTNLSLRTEPRANATKITSLGNGTIVPIIGEDGDFYVVDITLLDKVEGNGFGYVLKQYVNTNPYYITLQGTTQIWSNTWGIAPAVAEKSKGTKLFVVAENEKWFCVQLKKGTAGVGFIRKSVLGYSTYNYLFNGKWIGAPNAIVIKDNVPVYANANDPTVVVGYLNTDDIVSKVDLSTNAGYQSIIFNEVIAYVSSLNIIDIYGVQE